MLELLPDIINVVISLSFFFLISYEVIRTKENVEDYLRAIVLFLGLILLELVFVDGLVLDIISLPN